MLARCAPGFGEVSMRVARHVQRQARAWGDFFGQHLYDCRPCAKFALAARYLDLARCRMEEHMLDHRTDGYLANVFVALTCVEVEIA